MLRQFGARINRLDVLARDIGEGIELEPRTVFLDDRDCGARATLEALAAADPGREGLECPRQRFDLANAAAGVGIGEPEIAVRILRRERLLQRLDRANVTQAKGCDQ